MTIGKRKFGNTGIFVSEIGIGTSQLANVDGKYPGVKQISEKDAKNIIAKAIDYGINFFDTSDEYGASESLLGKLAHATKEKILIATKAGYRPSLNRCFERKYLIGKVETSLKKLDVEAIDLFQVNKPSMKQIEHDDMFSTLNQLKKEGKIKLAGMVVRSNDEGYKAIDSDSIDSIMVLYHLLFHDAGKLISAAGRKGKAVIVRSPFCSGILTGKIRINTKFDPDDYRREIFTCDLLEERLEILHMICTKLSITEAETLNFALQFILSKKGVSSVIPGVSSIEHLEELTKYSNDLLSVCELETIHKIVFERTQNMKFPFQNL